MTEATIWAVGGYAPPHVLTNDMLSQRMDTSDEWIRTRTGIRERRTAGPDESTASVSTRAGQAALQAAGFDPADLDWVFVCTDTPEMWSPATACFVQDMLGARHASAIDLTGGCAGFLQTLQIISPLAAQGKNLLVIGTELLTHALDWNDRSTAVLFGDGAGAFLVGPSQPGRAGIRIGHGLSSTDGSQAEILGKPYGGTRHEITTALVAEGKHHRIRMDGPRVFKHAVTMMSEVGRQVVSDADLTLDAIDWVVPHQANQRIIDAVAHQVGIPGNKVFSHVAQYANTGSASIGLALADMLEQSLIKPGQNLLSVAFGAGFSWASQLFHVDGIPASAFIHQGDR
ncbi:beta-ketoacyl-ACP synthase III [Sulfobacillus harzensis]|uniref:Ketoacyl-ACP synthase III n=1 Tax=Sulfobacillus harzensis TaxID=2729629 RepID=A0A7Y0Q3D6_9FIRM|nr:beta-ketoacyl-ACP synthase III [Sulfobacillus harzensis]NMP22084.1 ketoacyl-ACP synthase III [Sulfobacillus harzensis]